MININEMRQTVKEVCWLTTPFTVDELLELLDRLEEAERERDALRNEIACVKEVVFPRKVQAVADAWKWKCERLEAQCDAAETEALEQARLNGMGAERELALMAKLEAAEKETKSLREGLKRMCMDEDAEAKEAKVLRAKIAEMEKQEPVKHEFQGRDGTWHSFLDQRHYENTVADGRWPVRALYALPGAQPDQSVPDGYKLVPIELTHKMVGACYENWKFGDKSAQDIWRDMLAATTEDK